MALDYSKLSTEELEAIANDDYRKLSNRTLRALSNEPEPKSITDNIKDFGKATASLADTGINAVTGMLDYAAYPLARAFGRSPEQATQETTSPKDVIGRGLGITQDPAYENELSRRMMAGVGQGIENYAVKPLSSATGLPQQDVSNMVGSAMLGAGVKAQPYINRAGQAVAQGMYAAEPYITGALKAPIKAPVQFGKGLVEGLVNKEFNPATSAMVPLRDTYTPPAAAERFMGQLPGVPQQSLSQLQNQARPTSELVGGTAGRVAQAMSPKTLAGETLVPLRGQGMQAFGERVGRGVRTDTLQAMGEAGLIALTGIPFKTLAQGVGELGARYLGAKTGFMPGFSQQVGQAQKTAAQQQAFTPPPSSNGFTPPPGGYGGPPPPPGGGNGPISPSQIPPVTPAEISKQAALQRVQGQMSQQQGLTNPVSADFMSTVRETRPQYQTPQQMAIQKTQEIVSQKAPVLSPTQLMAQTDKGKELLARIRARQNPPPEVTVAGPVAPTAIQSLPSERWTPAEKLALERAKLQEQLPTPISAADEAKMQKQLAESQKSTNEEIIRQHAQGNIMGETTSLDTGKEAYNSSNSTKGKVKALMKAQVDSIPVINGMTEGQVIDALHKEVFGKQTKSTYGKPDVLEMKIGNESPKGSFKSTPSIELNTDNIFKRDSFDIMKTDTTYPAENLTKEKWKKGPYEFTRDINIDPKTNKIVGEVLERVDPITNNRISVSMSPNGTKTTLVKQGDDLFRIVYQNETPIKIEQRRIFNKGLASVTAEWSKQKNGNWTSDIKNEAIQNLGLPESYKKSLLQGLPNLAEIIK
jgi:hypothetical protein